MQFACASSEQKYTSEHVWEVCTISLFNTSIKMVDGDDTSTNIIPYLLIAHVMIRGGMVAICTIRSCHMMAV